MKVIGGLEHSLLDEQMFWEKKAKKENLSRREFLIGGTKGIGAFTAATLGLTGIAKAGNGNYELSKRFFGVNVAATSHRHDAYIILSRMHVNGDYLIPIEAYSIEPAIAILFYVLEKDSHERGGSERYWTKIPKSQAFKDFEQGLDAFWKMRIWKDPQGSTMEMIPLYLLTSIFECAGYTPNEANEKYKQFINGGIEIKTRLIQDARKHLDKPSSPKNHLGQMDYSLNGLYTRQTIAVWACLFLDNHYSTAGEKEIGDMLYPEFEKPVKKHTINPRNIGNFLK